MIRFIDKAGIELVPTGMSADNWHTLCNKRTVQLFAGSNVLLEENDNALVITASFSDTAENRYQQYINSKRLAMAYGNAQIGITNANYYFDRGYAGAIYAPDDHPFLKTLQAVGPATDGNISVVSSECVGLDAVKSQEQGAIVFCKDGSNCDPCESYVELNAFVWRLYHAFNDAIYRLIGFDPEKQYWSTIMSYQGMVARWNNVMWNSIYQSTCTPLRDTVTIRIGYNCVQCTASNVHIRTTLTLLSAFTPEGRDINSAAELVIYKQGVGQRGSFTATTVIQSLGGTAGDHEESGNGNERLLGSWVSKQIDVTIPAMKQNDSYLATFTLSRSLYAFMESDLMLPASDMDMPTHTLQLTTTWEVDGASAISRTTDPFQIYALDLPEETEESSSSSAGA